MESFDEKAVGAGIAGKALAVAAYLALALSITPRIGAKGTVAVIEVYRYACLDDAGRNTGTIEMSVTRNRGGLEIVSTDSAGIRGYARLGAGMLQEEVLIDTASGGTLRFKLSASGKSWDVEGG
jgi:hypothetical protein